MQCVGRFEWRNLWGKGDCGECRDWDAVGLDGVRVHMPQESRKLNNNKQRLRARCEQNWPDSFNPNCFTSETSNHHPKPITSITKFCITQFLVLVETLIYKYNIFDRSWLWFKYCNAREMWSWQGSRGVFVPVRSAGKELDDFQCSASRLFLHIRTCKRSNGNSRVQ